MTRALQGTLLLIAAGCSTPALPWDQTEPPLPPSHCIEQDQLGPSYSESDVLARIAMRQSALSGDEPAGAPAILRRRAPVFPPCAAEMGIEGACMVAFDVSPEGAAINILPACTSRLFERPLKVAMTGWAFEPPGEGPRPALLNRIVFRLADEAEAGPVFPAGETE